MEGFLADYSAEKDLTRLTHDASSLGEFGCFSSADYEGLTSGWVQPDVEDEYDYRYSPHHCGSEKQMRPVISQPSLPFDASWLIARAIDDYKALLVLGQTSETLGNIADEVLSTDRRIILNSAGVVKLQRTLETHPIRRHHLTRLTVVPSLLSAFIASFVNRLHRVSELIVEGAPSDLPLSLHPQIRLSLARFQSITMLTLHMVRFSTFGELVHTMCAFPNLRATTLSSVSYHRQDVLDLKDIRSAKSLALESLQVHLKISLTIPSTHSMLAALCVEYIGDNLGGLDSTASSMTNSTATPIKHIMI